MSGSFQNSVSATTRTTSSAMSVDSVGSGTDVSDRPRSALMEGHAHGYRVQLGHHLLLADAVLAQAIGVLLQRPAGVAVGGLDALVVPCVEGLADVGEMGIARHWPPSSRPRGSSARPRCTP